MVPELILVGPLFIAVGFELGVFLCVGYWYGCFVLVIVDDSLE